MRLFALLKDRAAEERERQQRLELAKQTLDKARTAARDNGASTVAVSVHAIDEVLHALS